MAVTHIMLVKIMALVRALGLTLPRHRLPINGSIV